jgi:hypothetical protein
MNKYPLGTRLLLLACMRTGLGVHEVYQLWAVSRFVIWLDKWAGKVSTRPK